MTIASNLPNSIENATALIDRLQELLENERQALGENNVDAIKELLPIKLSLLSQLEKNATDRGQILTAAGFEPDYAGVINCIDSLEGSKTLLARWSDLIEKLKECHATNEANGKIIHRSKQQVTSLLNLLCGQTESDKLYTHSGSSTAVNHQQPLAKA
jgi:flagella synthesis protein FlgN